jgi:glycerol-3-phosphate cytidylyltransferase-like family protein
MPRRHPTCVVAGTFDLLHAGHFRLLREAFRAVQPDLPAGLDLVVVARPHREWEPERYRAAIAESAAHLAKAITGTGHGTGS